MDRLDAADAVLAAASARSATVFLPGRVSSPMDCWGTMPIARSVIAACEPAALASAHDIPTLDRSDPVLDPEMQRAALGRPDGQNERRRA